MKKWLPDLHVYGGALLVSVGLALVAGIGWSLVLLGCALFYLGAFWKGR